MHTMKDLMKLNRNDSVVHAAMTHWQQNGYPSFEAMLIDLVCILAKCRHDMTERLHKATMEQTAPIIIQELPDELRKLLAEYRGAASSDLWIDHMKPELRDKIRTAYAEAAEKLRVYLLRNLRA